MVVERRTTGALLLLGRSANKWMMWILGIGVIVAFVAVCETVLFVARRNPQFVAKLYMLDDLVRFDGETSNADAEPHDPRPRDENERL